MYSTMRNRCSFFCPHNGAFVIIELLCSYSNEQLIVQQTQGNNLSRVNVRGNMNEVTRIINIIEQGYPQYIVLL